MSPLLIGVLIVSLLLLCLKWTFKSSSYPLKNKLVFITGGSSGIGESLAKCVIKLGGNVVLIARNREKLSKVKDELNEMLVHHSQRVGICSLDVTEGYSKVKKAFDQLEIDNWPVYMLINCAGSAACGKLEDTSEEDIKKMFTLNCLGSIYPTKAVVEGMKARGEGHIVFISSMAGLTGLFGYSAYSASKFALKGFAESLRMELKPYNVRVSVAFPPDTNTPGFAEEQKQKPVETKLIGDTAGLYEPNDVARQIMGDILDNKFMSAVGLDGYMITRLCAGMSPISSFIDLIVEVCMMGVFRIVSLGYLAYFDRIVNRCRHSLQS